MKSKHSNLTAYETYEVFLDNESEKKYRDSKIKSCDKHVRLLSKEFNKKKIKIIELGSGNSKLLINLYKKNLLHTGWGVEVSKSRYDFSQKWISDLNIDNIKNFNQDIINFDFKLVKNLDVCICVDLCFQFLEPVEKNSTNRILQNIYNSLKFGGKLILELDYCGYIISNLPYTSRIWEEFPPQDPWKYSLWDCIFDETNKILNWKKTFISRDNKYEKTEIFLKIFSKDEISTLLSKVGFKNIRVYKDWTYSKFDCDSREFIIIAEK